MKFRNHFIILKKISKFLRLFEKRNVIIFLFLSFIINILNELTRYFNNITFKKLKNDFINNKKICFTYKNSNNYYK